MITCRDIKSTVGRTQCVLFRTIVFMAFALGVVQPLARGQLEGPLPYGEPTLQRMIVLEQQSYALDYAEPRGSWGRALVRIERDANHGNKAVSFFLFGRVVGPGRMQHETPAPSVLRAYRWTVGPQSVFMAKEYEHCPDVGRYPMYAFVVEPDGTGMFDSTKLPGAIAWGGGKFLPSFGPAPVARYRDGIKGWQEGDNLSRSGLIVTGEKPVIHWDFRALADERIEFYLTVDGKLERWDGVKPPIDEDDPLAERRKPGRVLEEVREWRLIKRYPVELQGPFLVSNAGSAVVGESDDHWCMITPLQGDAPRPSKIVVRKPDVPLLVIEDTVAVRTYFEQEGKVYDENGMSVYTLPASVKGPARFEALAEFVWSQRQK
jgi:hypothetical protein